MFINEKSIFWNSFKKLNELYEEDAAGYEVEENETYDQDNIDFDTLVVQWALGKEYAAKFDKIKFMLKRPECDIEYWLKKDPQDLKNKIEVLWAAKLQAQQDWENLPEFEITNNTLIRCNGKSEHIVVPNNIQLIRAAAFAESEVKDLKINQHVTPIKSIVLPESVKSLGLGACYGCKELESINIPNNITTIKRATFAYCFKLGSIKLSNNLINIEPHAFSACMSLKTITIPASLKSIGVKAFSNCTSLTDIYYEGSEEDWKLIHISKHNNDSLFTAKLHFNSK